MRAKYLVTNNRIVLKLFAAKNPWSVLLFVIPIQIILFFLINEEGGTLHHALLMLPFSFIYWSFVEYCIHRWYFHWIPKNQFLRFITGSFHLYHHENPDDLEVINSGWVTGVMGVFLHFAIFRFLFQLSYVVSLELTFSLILIYYVYEWVHYLVHQRIFPSGLMNYLQNFHLTHHVSPKKNFGQLSPIWDYILGTMRGNLETRDTPRMLAFIKEKGQR